MARRSSARLRSRNSTTPQRVSLAHDVVAPRTVPAKLASLDEGDEMPGAFPQSPTGTPTRPSKRVARGSAATPKASTPIEPSDEEMHPQQHHQTTMKPLQEARHLGFSNMGAYTEPPKQKSKIATMQATPTKVHNPAEDIKSPNFQFTFRREQSLELSPEAKKLMNEKREEAARIRDQMVASGETSIAAFDSALRKIATPKSKKGRYSDVHGAAFQKMDSIAGHASAFRADPNRLKAARAPAQSSSSPKIAEGQKSLKRSPSKAQLDEQEAPRSHQLQRSPSKPGLAAPRSGLPSAPARPDVKATSPAKRIKRTEQEDVSTTRPASSSDEDKSLPATPQQNKTLRMHPNNPSLANLTTPTQSSIARAASVKFGTTTKIPAPHLVRSPSKPTLPQATALEAGPSTPSLARSPSKTNLESVKKTGVEVSAPLLARSPTKAALFPETKVQRDVADGQASPLLARSPLKGSFSKNATGSEDAGAANVPKEPLLARSPLKMSFAKHIDTEIKEQKPSSTPLLARSPSKIAMPSSGKNFNAPQTPGKSFGSGLMGRFKLLRSSPMKSILRSPQRLYSDDPAKVAAGTHLATPPKQAPVESKTPQSRLPGPPASARKRVDFTSSTKERYEASQSPPNRTSDSSSSAHEQSVAQESTTPSEEPPMSFGYPDLSAEMPVASPSPQKRRQTVAPNDFTFRAGDHGIVFGQSPNARPGDAKNNRPSIRHVSAEPTFAPSEPVPPPTVQGSKKRKFEFENSGTTSHAPSAEGEDKENVEEAAEDEEQRPAKRAKSNPAEPVTTKAAPPTRVPTLGVKPKGVKTAGKDVKAKAGRPSTISQARLNALSQPKKRG